MFKRTRQFLRDQSGATAVEYAVMLALILMTCIGAVALFGMQTATLWSTNSNSISGVVGS